MIKILDRYLAAAVLRFFLVGQLAFFGLFIFIDLLDKVFKVQAGPEENWIVTIFFFYLYQLPGLFETTAPFILVLSCLIALARLQHNSQLVAINASSISTHRLIECLLFLSLMVGGGIFSSQEWLSPYGVRNKMTILQQDWLQGGETLSFRDHLYFPNGDLNHLLSFERSPALIDIEKLEISKSQGAGFHATLVDELQRPRLKIFASSFTWNQDETLLLNNPKVISYELDRLEPNISDFKVHGSIPLRKVLLASRDLRALSINDLQLFSTNREAYTEMVFRLINPFMPMLMMLVSSVLALPLIFHKPVFAYFAGLGCCFGIFFSGSYLKGLVASGELGGSFAALLLATLSIGIYVFKMRDVPT
jgi:lipopolysaccharide export LptBFGC system permease protein LptF